MSDIDDLLGPAPETEKPEHYDRARAITIQEQRASTSWLQRQLGIGYNKAAELIAVLEQEGVVSEQSENGRRVVLVKPSPDDETVEVEDTPVHAKKLSNRDTSQVSAQTVQTLLRPVSITFLSEVLGQDRKAITRKLAELPPVATYRNSVPLYNFRQALEYLVKPKIDAAEVIRKMGLDELPVGLQKDVWDARLKQQKWMQEAGELWPTDDVLEVLGDAFQRIKSTTQLWVDQLADTHALPDEARADLVKAVDGLQQSLHQTLVEMPTEKATGSQASQIEGTPLDV